MARKLVTQGDAAAGAALLALGAALSLCAPACEAANILAVFPVPGKSHWIVFRELLLELSRRGHNLTVISHFPLDEPPPPNWEQIFVGAYHEELPSGPNLFDLGTSGAMQEVKFLMAHGRGWCRRALEEEDMRKLVASKDRRYDLLLIEVFFNDCLFALAHKFRVPTVGACALGGGASWMGDTVGNPYPHSYLPEPFLKFTSRMSLPERLYNAFFGTYFRLVREFSYLPQLDAIVRERFGDANMPPLSHIQRNMSLLLVNSHVSFYYPRPLVPNLIEVGGMHIKPPKKLPDDLRAFMDEATDGVIFFSMGTNIKSEDIPEKQKEAILRVFSKLKQKILWKVGTERLPNQPANVRLGKWLPQYDVLKHKNTKLFITHGGLMSIQEAISAGVPLLGVPVFGDQQVNLGRVESGGFGIMLTMDNITETSFGWALSELLTNPRYQEMAKKKSVVFHDRPQKPLDTAVYWVEYVLRHGGAAHMRSASLDLSWYQYLLLDVAAVALAALFLALSAVTLITTAVFRRITKNGSVAQTKKKHTKDD
ncbi:UDP-glycosyltransferase UGT5-like [Schistocerca cancellata]|uniref:UDP-glycosyltransferase UGT5-like n=1 Tax=Schistocerca cancellata TaxID=274614 RepID=UPI00211967AB|nr:UDP-glycosyltransferase UGT5-like [Schistocerca cancellata]